MNHQRLAPSALFIFKPEYPCIAQAGLELMFLLHPPPEWCDDKCIHHTQLGHCSLTEEGL
jgi:hypothetical protein